MKKIKIYLFTALLLPTLASCEKDIRAFDNGTNYIHFNMPFVLDRYSRPTTERVDSIFYSFALDDKSVTTYTFKVPVNTVGLASDVDRPYRVEIDTEQTTATADDWSPSILDDLSIKAGELRDTIFLTVNRNPGIADQWHTIVLNMLPSDDFTLGVASLQSARISFTDMLIPPDWWDMWDGYFGEFVKEKYLKWQEIYYLGADPNVQTSGPKEGVPYYWDNMPTSTVASWYPVTFMYIRILKQYFIDNEVYPDGDTTKPRITLP